MNRRPAFKVSLSEQRDLPLLRFLWKWKLATTAALTEKFFAGLSPITAHKRLWQLAKASYIRAQSIGGDGRSFVWGLDKNGFHAIRDSLPGLQSEGYKSEYLAHDFLVTAFHMGDFFWGVPDGVLLFSEQQLRRYDFEFYPKSIPKTTLHRPDGYIVLNSPERNQVIAIEVEMTPKRKTDYEQVCDFYRHQKIDEIFWLVPRETMANRLGHVLKENHSFVSYPDFKDQGWGAVFSVGARSGLSLREVLGNTSETSSHIVSTQFLLDTKKAPHRSKTCGSFEIAKILD